MTFEDKINEDLKLAMKAKNQVALRGIRAIKSAILLAKTDGSGQEIDEQKSIHIVQKLLKQRNDSLEIYDKQNRQDLAEIEREEINILNQYLPVQLSDEEVEKNILEIINELGATSMKDMGKIMDDAVKKLSGKTDSKTISIITKKLLNSL